MCFADLKAVIYNFSQILQASLKCVCVTLPKEREKTSCQIHQLDCLRGRKSWYQSQASKAIRYDPVSSSLFWKKAVWNWEIPSFCNKWKTWDWGNNFNKVEMYNVGTLYSLTSLKVWETFSIQNYSVYKARARACGAARVTAFCISWSPRYLEEAGFPPLIPLLPAMRTHTTR